MLLMFVQHMSLLQAHMVLTHMVHPAHTVMLPRHAGGGCVRTADLQAAAVQHGH